MMNTRWHSTQRSTVVYFSLIGCTPFSRWPSIFRKTPEDNAGTRVKATKRLAKRAYVMVRPMSAKSSREIPSVKTTGRKTQIVVNVEATMAAATCFAPSTAASCRARPISRQR